MQNTSKHMSQFPRNELMPDDKNIIRSVVQFMNIRKTLVMGTSWLWSGVGLQDTPKNIYFNYRLCMRYTFRGVNYVGKKGPFSIVNNVAMYENSSQRSHLKQAGFFVIYLNNLKGTHFVIIYSPSCCSKPQRVSIFYWK